MAKQFFPYRQRGACLWALIVLVVAGCSGALTTTEKAALEDPKTVALYADTILTLDEFETRYARTVGGVVAAREDSLQEYQDFLERYVNFRLKVMAADSAGYDQDSTILSEINNYRTSFARPYLIDKEVMNPILSDLYEKNKELIEASHLLLRLRADAPPEDTLGAYQKIAALRDSVQSGMDFGDLAFRHSEDPSAKNEQATQGYRGWLGFFTAGRMVKAFEDMAYQTPLDEVSPIFRTQFGYHLVYVHDRRPIIPDLRISHLMIRPAGTTPADSAEALQRIEGLKRQIEEGADFATVAREHSDERNSGRNGGDLGFLRYDNYNVDPTFREAAFAMEDMNKVSAVITTRYGYHLFMITERRELGTFEEEYESLKQTASRLPRLRNAENTLAQDARERYTASIDTTALLHLFDGVALDTLIRHVRTTSFSAAAQATPVAMLGDSTYTFGQLVTFAQNPDHFNLIKNMLDQRDQVVEIADAFLNQAAISQEALLLEHRDAEFGLIMGEFRDGLKLFKLMEDSVWTAAAQDSAGLQAYYEVHRDRYQYPERTRILEAYSYSDSLLDATVERLDQGLSWSDLYAELAADSTSKEVLLDSMLVAGITNSVYDKALDIEEGTHTAPIPHRTGLVVLFRDGTEPPRGKTLEEARAEVVNDYQQVLENRLIERLRRLYRVRTFPERLDRAFLSSPSPDTTMTREGNSEESSAPDRG